MVFIDPGGSLVDGIGLTRAQTGDSNLGWPLVEPKVELLTIEIA